MKVSKLFLAAAVVCTLASCTRDYTCTCTIPGVPGITEDETIVTTYEGLSSSEASDLQAICESGGDVCTWE